MDVNVKRSECVEQKNSHHGNGNAEKTLVMLVVIAARTGGDCLRPPFISCPVSHQLPPPPPSVPASCSPSLAMIKMCGGLEVDTYTGKLTGGTPEGAVRLGREGSEWVGTSCFYFVVLPDNILIITLERFKLLHVNLPPTQTVSSLDEKMNWFPGPISFPLTAIETWRRCC